MFCRNMIITNMGDTAALYIEEKLEHMIKYQDIYDIYIKIKENKLFLPEKNEIIAILSRECTHIIGLIYTILSYGATFVFLSFKNTVDFNLKQLKVCNASYIITACKENNLSDTNYVQLFNSKLAENEILKVNLNSDLCPCNINLIKSSCITYGMFHIPHISYVINTSGTMGKPKCVYVPETCIMTNIYEMSQIFLISFKDVVLLASSLTFDMSMFEILLSFSSGACLLIVPEILKRMPINLLTTICAYNVTIIQATPSLLRLLYANTRSSAPNVRLWNRMMEQLRILALGGEPCPPIPELRAWVADLRSNSAMCRGPKLRIFNLYGLTEQSCWSMYYEIPHRDLYEPNYSIPQHEERYGVQLGRPMAGTRIALRKIESSDEDTIHEYARSHSGNAVSFEYGELCVGSSTRGSNPCDTDSTRTKRPLDIVWEDCNDNRSSGCGELKSGGRRVCYIAMPPRSPTLENRPDGDNFVQLSPNLLPTGDMVVLIRLKETDTEQRSDQVYYLRRLNGKPEGRGGIVKRMGHRISTELIRQVADSCPVLPIGTLTYVQVVRGGQEVDGSTITRINLFLFIVEDGSVSHNIDTLKIGLRQYLTNNLPYYSSPDQLFFCSQSHIPLTAHGKFDAKNLSRVPTLCTKSSNHLPKNESSITSHLIKEWLTYTNNSNHDQVIDGDRVPRDQDDFLSMGGDSVGAIALSEELSARTGYAIEASVILEDILYRDFSAVRERIVNTGPQIPKSSFDGDICSDESLRPLTYSDHRDDVLPASARNTVEHVISYQDHSTYRYTDYGDYNLNFAKPFVIESSVDKTNVGDHRYGDKWDIKIVASYDVGQCLDATPLVVNTDDGNEYMYVGCHSGWFYAFRSVRQQNIEDQEVLQCPVAWKTRLGGRIEASAAYSPKSDLIVIGSYDHNVYVLNRWDGALLWKYLCGAEVKCCPAIDVTNEVAYFGCHDRHVYAIHLTNRRHLWKIECPDGASVFSSPCLISHTSVLVVATLRGSVYGLDTVHGQILWSLEGTCSITDKPIFSSPCIAGVRDQILCLGSVDGHYYFCDSRKTDYPEHKDYSGSQRHVSLPTGGSIFAPLAKFSPLKYVNSFKIRMIGSQNFSNVKSDSAINPIPNVQGGIEESGFVPKKAKRFGENETITPIRTSLSIYEDLIVGGSYDGNLYVFGIGEISAAPDKCVETNDSKALQHLGSIEHRNIDLISTAKLQPGIDIYGAARPFIVEYISRPHNGQLDPECDPQLASSFGTKRRYEIIVLVVNKKGEIFLIEPDTGKVLYNYSLNVQTYSTPVISGSNIYIGTRDDRFIQMKLSRI